ncbi:hypothetical protein E2562_011230 [Oryza meyeriana var. granulata]|uniref:DUF834 domain-containing protein n=1 Tax=Oryza meyeriana var. granulata TaxID=110450 RepID=A0A6G1DGM6_9ORYZ|nr:hypothetical protein E2562_011230 [Oryza meyeriana var. granulata]
MESRRGMVGLEKTAVRHRCRARAERGVAASGAADERSVDSGGVGGGHNQGANGNRPARVLTLQPPGSGATVVGHEKRDGRRGSAWGSSRWSKAAASWWWLSSSSRSRSSWRHSVVAVVRYPLAPVLGRGPVLERDEAGRRKTERDGSAVAWAASKAGWRAWWRRQGLKAVRGSRPRG